MLAIDRDTFVKFKRNKHLQSLKLYKSIKLLYFISLPVFLFTFATFSLLTDIAKCLNGLVLVWNFH